mgnify:CR=1 FL=1
MPDWVSEHIGEIALLIYIFYPLLKRWWDRSKKKRQQKRRPAEAKAEAPATATARDRTTAQQPRQPPAPKQPRAAAEPKRPSESDFLAAARAQVDRLKQETSRSLARAERDPRLARLVPALREDLLARLNAIERSLSGGVTLSTVVQDTTMLRGLAELLRYLNAMAQQRMYGTSSFLGEADAIADACYAPLLDFARLQGIDLKTSTPVSVSGDWELSIVPRFASTRVAPLRLPVGFENNVARWPAIAHEVAHDFYFSVDSLEPELHDRLGLPDEVELPMSERELGGAWLRQLFGAWLAEVFADAMGTVMLGPAYVEAMGRAFRNPQSPQQTAAIFQDGGLIDEHPPARLRVYMATRVLHHLGRHEEADALWERWESDHQDVRFYYLPLGGQWVGLSDDALHSIADSVIDVLVQRPWPELEGFQLLNIPGFAYLHPEHAEVQRLMPEIALGETVRADPRWIMAAAVLAAAAQPTLHDQILEAARRSIVGVGEPEAPSDVPSARLHPTGTIAEDLVASLKRPDAIQEAIILGAALTPYKRPRWR